MSMTQRCGIESRVRRRTYAGVAALVVMLAGCASQPGTSPGAPVAGGSDRPLQDGTPEFRADIMTIPDAVPRPEPVTSAGNKSPYTVLGTTYRVAPARPGYRERGFASWYGTKFHGQYTSNGEPYDVYTMTAAHKTLPIPCYVRVKNVENGRSIVVRVNDRGPFHEGRVLDLSYAAAYRLGYANKGTALVELEVLDPMAPEWVAKRREMAGDARLVASQAVARKTYLQAGAFRSMDGARSLQQTLASLLGHDVFIHRSTDAASPWYRVRIGPLESTEALEDARRRLAAASIAGAQVVTE
ncbi:MAG TPA: septal ring lytic transglycosylase RlpA family protein [Pseudomonadales bacterium]|nr:septal ring lytic transglycosylase RlpA family protein [Pseudomonadales bacterium]HNC68961.1 septal ring lytic transglycosylase RlpA family protein [Pseudomonadales bacterium]